MITAIAAIARRTRPAELLLWPAIGLSLLLVAAGTGLVAPLVPLLVLGVVIALFTAPVRHSALVVLGVGIIADYPGEHPMMNRWRSPSLPIGELLYTNLHVFTKIEAMRFSGLELLFILLGLVMFVRLLTDDPLDRTVDQGALPGPMKGALALWLGTVIMLEMYGLARHGDFRNSLWQLRQLFWFPILAALFGKVLTTTRSRLWLLRTVLIAACIRALEGIYFYFAVFEPSPVRPAYVTTHSDSVLTVLAILLGIMVFVSRPCRTHLVLNLIGQPILLSALVLNNRRIAFVSLLGGLLAMLTLSPPAARAAVRRIAVMALPLLLIFVAVGWNSKSGLFRPVASLRSVLDKDNRSNQTRDIENYNLIRTLKHQPLFGSGFGQVYEENVRADRVDQFMANYRYIAHNSVLWLFSVSGWIGFTSIWLTLPVGILIILRVYEGASGMVDRVTAFGALVAIVCFVVQAWGDMGLQSWMATLLLAGFMGGAVAAHGSMSRPEVTA